ncbi:MAG TPA: isoprenylcysteine carboxylmethyltransferase family protein [Beijerinckiaceae bacterium]|jgi:protein-S-isoprenylcysteine O-methyltransferase Ste14
MNDHLQRPNEIPWPPLVYVGAFFVAAVLQKIMPIDFVDRWLALVPDAFGYVVVAAGLALDGWAMQRLWVADTAIMPTSAADALVTDGPYAHTRNPIYIGNTVVLAGVALGLAWTWLLLVLPPVLFLVQALAVLPEEEHLAARFDSEWRAYAARVPRWL